jgi:hypothetical protein
VCVYISFPLKKYLLRRALRRIKHKQFYTMHHPLSLFNICLQYDLQQLDLAAFQIAAAMLLGQRSQGDATLINFRS